MPASHDQPSSGSQRVLVPPRMRKQSAAVVRRTTPTTSGENPASAPLVATGTSPQHAAAPSPNAKPARRVCRGAEVTTRTKHALTVGSRAPPTWRRRAERLVECSRPMPRPAPAPTSERYARYVLAVLVIV